MAPLAAACGQTQSLTEEPRQEEEKKEAGRCSNMDPPIGMTALGVSVRSERNEPVYAAVVITEQLFRTGAFYDSLRCGTDRDGSCGVGYSGVATAPMSGWNPVRITVQPPRAYSITTVNDSAFYSLCRVDSTERIIAIVVPDTSGQLPAILAGKSE